MRRNTVRILYSPALGLLVAVSCGDDDKVCDPGEQDSCGCPDGSIGSQQCKSSGEGWNDCICGSSSSSGTTSSSSSSGSGITCGADERQCGSNQTEVGCAVYCCDDFDTFVQDVPEHYPDDSSEGRHYRMLAAARLASVFDDSAECF